VALIIGVSTKTIDNWKKKHPDFFRALKEAKSVPDELVEISLFRKATGYHHPETKVFQHEGDIITEEVERYHPPDTVAAIFWLKNRRPDRWRDDKKIVVEGEVDHTVKVSKIDLDARINQLKKKSA
jgi:hypothetical protein